MKLNGNFQNLQQSYLFVTIAKKVAAYTQEHPDNKIIKMGIGDVTMPLAPAVIEAMHQATEEQAHKETFHGYSPDSDGYPFLREAIANYYKNFAWTWTPPRCLWATAPRATWAPLWICSMWTTPCWCPTRCTLCMWIPNIISGRNIAYMDANEQNGFLPLPDESVKAGHHLPVLPQQPHRRHLQQGAAAGLGGLRPGAEGRHPV